MNQSLLLCGVVGALIATAPAQSPCVNPSSNVQTFRTLFDGTTYLGTPSVTDGANMFFDLTLTSDVTISRIGINLLDDGSAAPGGVATPNLVGQTSFLVVWLTPTTAIGNTANAAVWNQVAIGNLTVAPPDSPSNALFNGVAPATGPFTLTAGSYGVALQHIPIGAALPPNPFAPGSQAGTVLHPLYTNPAALPTPTTFSDQFLTLNAAGLGGQANPFVSGVAQPRVINCEIDYAVPANTAYSTPYGSGCYDRKASFYEHFAAPGSIDLTANLTMINLGPNYQVIPGVGVFIPPVSASLTLNPPAQTSTASWDDAHTGPIALPASWGAGFPYPGGVTPAIDIGSNGYVFLQPGTSTLAYYGATSGLLNDAARLCPAWGDWDPATGGSMHYDVGPGEAYVAITWLNVPEWNQPGTSVSFQMILYPSGQVDFVYQGTVGMVAAAALVGWSPGGGAADPGSMDITATVPFQTGDGTVPAVLSMSARPVLGTTPNMVTTNLNAATNINIVLLSLAPLPGIDLATLGLPAPGCRTYIGLTSYASLGLTLGSGTSSLPLNLPNNPAFVGAQMFGQAVQLTPPQALNAAGVLVSNAVCISLGL